MPLAKDGFKVCFRCKEQKPVSEFYTNKTRKDGLYNYCKPCSRIDNQDRHEKRKHLVNNPVSCTEKECPMCKETKPALAFYVAPINKDGLSWECRECCSKGKKKRFDRIRRSEPKLPESGTKTCHACGEEKDINAFSRNRARPDHRDVYCKECTKPLQTNRYMKMQYGISKDQYDQMLEEQNHCCFLCGEPESLVHMGKVSRLAIDHSHVTNKCRRLMCNRCNISIGGVEYFLSKNMLDKVLQYLKDHG